MNLIQRFSSVINALLDSAEQANRGQAAAIYASMAMLALFTTVVAVLMLIVGVHLASMFLVSGSAFIGPCAS